MRKMDFVRYLTLPDHKNIPSSATQFAYNDAIPRRIAASLLQPKLSV